MENKNFRKMCGLSLGHLIRGSRTSYTFTYLIAGLSIIFEANLLLNMMGLSIGGMNSLGLGNVFRVFIVISLISVLPMVIITSIQLLILRNGRLHPAVIYDVTRDRNHLIVNHSFIKAVHKEV